MVVIIAHYVLAAVMGSGPLKRVALPRSAYYPVTQRLCDRGLQTSHEPSPEPVEGKRSGVGFRDRPEGSSRGCCGVGWPGLDVLLASRKGTEQGSD